MMIQTHISQKQIAPCQEKILTVCVAAYNGEETVSKALESCLTKNMNDLEVLVVDDGSEDRTFQEADQFVSAHPDTFRVIRQTNGGYGSALMTGLAQARGKYFRTLDCDDWFDPHAMEDLVDYLKSCDTDLVFSNYCTVRDEQVQTVFDVCKGRVARQVYPCDDPQETPVDMEIHGMTCRTSLLRESGVRLPFHCSYTDMAYTYIGMCAARNMSFLPVTLYHYRLGRDGQSVSLENYQKHFEDYARVTELILELAEQLPDNNKGNLLRNRARDIAQYGIELQLRFAPSPEVKKRLIAYDTALRTRHPDTARRMTNKNTRLLRASRYLLYRLTQQHAQKKALRQV